MTHEAGDMIGRPVKEVHAQPSACALFRMFNVPCEPRFHSPARQPRGLLAVCRMAKGEEQRWTDTMRILGMMRIVGPCSRIVPPGSERRDPPTNRRAAAFGMTALPARCAASGPANPPGGWSARDAEQARREPADSDTARATATGRSASRPAR
jgi:hypothetical protein